MPSKMKSNLILTSIIPWWLINAALIYCNIASLWDYEWFSILILYEYCVPMALSKPCRGRI